MVIEKRAQTSRWQGYGRLPIQMTMPFQKRLQRASCSAPTTRLRGHDKLVVELLVSSTRADEDLTVTSSLRKLNELLA